MSKQKAVFNLINMYKPINPPKTMRDKDWAEKCHLWINMKDKFHLNDFSKLYKILKKLSIDDLKFLNEGGRK